MLGYYMIKYFLNYSKNFHISIKITGVIIIGSLVLWLLIKFTKWIAPISRVEYISCMLNKIAKQLSFYNENTDDKELKKILKNLNSLVKVKREFPLEQLFKDQIQIQNRYYDELENLPKRIYHALINKSLNKIDPTKLKNLAYYIYNDDTQKTNELNMISEQYSSISQIRMFDLSKIKRLFDKKWILLSVWIIILLMLGFALYRWFDFDKNNILLMISGLMGVIAYIIYKK